VEGVDLDIRAGEAFALVGESGSGKSAIASAVMGLSLYVGGRVSGTIEVAGHRVDSVDGSELRRLQGQEICLIPQDPGSALSPVRTIRAQMRDIARAHLDVSPAAADTRAAELLASLGIPSPTGCLAAYPFQLSGGMLQRVLIAMALLCDPKVVIADEVTTALDVSVQAQILSLLSERIKGAGMTLLIISHDLAVVAGIADRVGVMYGGRIVEVGATEEVFYRPQHPYTKALLACSPGQTTARKGGRLPSVGGEAPDPHRRPAGCGFASRCQVALDKCASDRPGFFGEPNSHQTACWLADTSIQGTSEGGDGDRAEPTAEPATAADAATVTSRQELVSGTALLQVRGLSVQYPGDRTGPLRRRRPVHAVDGLSLDIPPGGTVGLVGESGSGKSSAARGLLRLEPIASGTVTFAGQDITKASARRMRELRPRIQLMLQDSTSSFDPRLTVAGSLAEALRVAGDGRHGSAAVAELLEMVRLPRAVAGAYPQALSGGQRQRVAIARVLATKPSLVIADEPTSALDVSVRADILNLLNDLQRRQGLGYLIITHDLDVVRYMCDLVAVMYLGRIVEMGHPRDVYENPQHPYTQALLDAVPVPDPRVQRAKGTTVIAGEIPSPQDPPTGCHFNPRCPHAVDRCRHEAPELREGSKGHHAACYFAESYELAGPSAPAMR
jgi:peptide/nickel transport system ATP-binding protein